MAEENVSLDSFLEMDDAESASPVAGFPGNMPTLEELLEMLEKAPGFTDEEREQLRQDLLSTTSHGDVNVVRQQLFASPFIFLSIALVLLLFILGFFAYNIIKWEKDKESARELKRSAKQERRRKKRS